MTRVNLVDPAFLTDQHLMAEYREIKMVRPSLERSIRAFVAQKPEGTPAEFIKARVHERYRLGSGHVSFFYDKFSFLFLRFLDLRTELDKRGYSLSPESRSFKSFCFGEWNPLPCGWVWQPFDKMYQPDDNDRIISRQRIRERILQKPDFYRYHGRPIVGHDMFDRLTFAGIV